MLDTRIPPHFDRYVEPFVGGGALFFHLQPERALISDSNPELINLYRQIALDVEAVIMCLKNYENTADTFYATRSLRWQDMRPCEAAARTIYLNRTCFNGLYRVNRKGDIIGTLPSRRFILRGHSLYTSPHAGPFCRDTPSAARQS